ncbi:MAG: hypothetical protein AAGK22_21420 [Acidobacteriota bacterium]
MQPLRLAFIALALAGALSVLIAPLAYAVSNPGYESALNQDVLTPWIAAVTMALAVLIRRRGEDGVAVALLIGGGVGLAMIGWLTLQPMRGFGAIVPPLLGLAVGLLDGVGQERFDGFRQSLIACCGLGIPVSLSLAPTQTVGVVVPGLLISFIVGVVLGSRRDPDRGWRGGLRRPPWWLLVVTVSLFVLFVVSIYRETQDGRTSITGGIDPALFSLLFVTLLFLVAPVFTFSLGSVLGNWIRPRLSLYGELVHYLEAMSVPIGAFALGYALLVTVFSGFYGSLARLDASHFAALEGEPTRWDFFFYALSSATGVGIGTVQATSVVAQLLVALQTLLGLGWAVVVFAVVMTQLQPRLQEIGDAIRASRND